MEIGDRVKVLRVDQPDISPKFVGKTFFVVSLTGFRGDEYCITIDAPHNPPEGKIGVDHLFIRRKDVKLIK